MENMNQSWHMVIWRNIMQRIHEGLEYKDFTIPSSVVQRTICTQTCCPHEDERFRNVLPRKTVRFGNKIARIMFPECTAKTCGCSESAQSSRICDAARRLLLARVLLEEVEARRQRDHGVRAGLLA